MSNIIEIGGGASGGSNVVANPIEAASDTLTKIGIDGTVYDISGGGSGSGYSETVLWSGSETPSTSGTQLNLTDNISSYDEIVFVMDTDYVGSNSFLVSQLTIGEDYIGTIYAPSHYGAYWSYDSDTTITIKSQSSANLKTYTKVLGIKYGGGASGHNYSTTEQLVGTWIDGSELYEITFTTSSVIPFGSWGNLDSLSSLNVDTVVNIEGVLRVNEDGDAVYCQYSTGLSFGLMYNETTKYIMARQGILSQTGGKNFTTHYTITYTKANA